MIERRPEWLEAEIDAHAPADPACPPDYKYKGDVADYGAEAGAASSADFSLLTELLAAETRKLRILDIGAGIGGFVLAVQQGGHDAQAVSVHDYRAQSPVTRQLAHGSYLVGDANRLDAIHGLGSEYDLIVSRNTFFLMVDPLGALEQALNRVAPGGTLAVADIALGPGVRGGSRLEPEIDSDAVVMAVRQAGFLAGITEHSVARSQGSAFELFDIFATRGAEVTPVNLPVDYQRAETGWRYIPQTALAVRAH